MSTLVPGRFQRFAEIEVVVLAATPHPAAEHDARIRELIAGDLDWDRLVAYAGWHRVLPVVHATLNRVGQELIPEQGGQRFAVNAAATLLANLRISGELLRLARMFAERGMTVVPFKGPVLSLQAYGNLAFRPFTDLDLLVRPEDVPAVQELLGAAGYRPVTPLTAAQEQAYLRYEHDRSFLRQESGVVLELHWRFFARYVAFPIDLKRLWGRLDRFVLAGTEVPVLPAEEMLLVLALHGAKHRWSSLGWILDIARLPGAFPEFDWERVSALARETGGERALLLALGLADALWGMPMPEPMRAAGAGDMAVQRLVGQVIAGLACLDRPAVSAAEDHRFYLASRERLADRLRYCWLWTFTPNLRDQTFLTLPAWLSPLHYLVRPVRMAADLLGRALQR